MMRMCVVPDCEKPAFRRGYCLIHTAPDIRFQRHAIPVPSGCWEWTSAVNSAGYGTFSVHGRHVYAHRWSYEHFVGPIPSGLLVMHACDNPPCVNPEHLSVGTQRDNLADMIAKGRSTKPWCPRGHEFTPENTIAIMSRGKPARRCRKCQDDWRRRVAEAA